MAATAVARSVARMAALAPSDASLVSLTAVLVGGTYMGGGDVGARQQAAQSAGNREATAVGRLPSLRDLRVSFSEAATRCENARDGRLRMEGGVWDGAVGALTGDVTAVRGAIAQYAEAYPLLFLGYDRNGQPVTAERLDSIDFPSLRCIVGSHLPLAVHSLRMELQRDILTVATRRKGEPVHASTHLVDLEGLTLSGTLALASDAWLRGLIGVRTDYDSVNHPNAVSRAIVLNAPYWFSLGWTALRPLLAPSGTRIEVWPKDGIDGLSAELADACAIPATLPEWRSWFGVGVDVGAPSSLPARLRPVRLHAALLAATAPGGPPPPRARPRL